MSTVLITGAARGIGRSMATHLASRRWDVSAGVRTDHDAADVVAIRPGRISSVMLEVTNDLTVS